MDEELEAKGKSMKKNGTGFQGFLQGLTDHLGTKIVSVILAFLLWGVVLGSQTVEVTKEVQVEVVTSADVVVSNEVPDRVLFRLSGPKAFLRTILDRHEEPIRINLGGVKPSVLTYRFFSDGIRVPIGVKVLSVNPAAVPIKLEYLKKKDVPVLVDLRGTPPEGFRLGGVQLKPDVVRIKGPESRVDAVNEVATKPIDLAGLKGSVEKEVPLDLTRLGVQLEGALPRASIQLDQVSPNFKIKNVDIRVLSSYKVRVEEKTVTVLVRAAQRDVEKLDRNQVFALVDLRDRRKGRYVEPVQVRLPPRVGLVKVIPNHVTVTLY
jgi:YbbR domain-containing protein